MSGKIRFGVYELDRDAMELRKHGVPIRLQEQPLRVLAMLAERPGEVISREQLQEQIWGNTFVDFDQSLNKAVNRVREALNDNAGTPQYIETVPRRGYRFIAPVAADPQTEAHAPAASVSYSPGLRFSATQIPSITLPDRPPRRAGNRDRARRHRHHDRRVVEAAHQARLAGTHAYHVLWCVPRAFAGWEAAGLHVKSWRRHAPYLGATDRRGRSDSGDHGFCIQEACLTFSPDGTRIAFSSAKERRRNLHRLHSAGRPEAGRRNPRCGDSGRFSPDGQTASFTGKTRKHLRFLWMADNRSLCLSTRTSAYISRPIWSPNGKEILFYGVRRRDQSGAAAWWIAPVGEGQSRLAQLPGIEQNYDAGGGRARVDSERGPHANGSSTLPLATKAGSFGASESLRGAYTMTSRNWSLPAMAISCPSSCASEEGKLAYNIWSSTVSIYQISVGGRGQKLAPALPITSPRGWMAQLSVRLPGQEGGWRTTLRAPASPTPSC